MIGMAGFLQNVTPIKISRKLITLLMESKDGQGFRNIERVYERSREK